VASITIRNLDEEVKARLRVRAAGRGHSMEEEARQILREAVERQAGPTNLAAAIRGRFEPLGGVELELPPRERMRVGISPPGSPECQVELELPPRERMREPPSLD